MGVTTVRRHMASATLTWLTIIAGCGYPIARTGGPEEALATASVVRPLESTDDPVRTESATGPLQATLTDLSVQMETIGSAATIAPVAAPATPTAELDDMVCNAGIAVEPTITETDPAAHPDVIESAPATDPVPVAATPSPVADTSGAASVGSTAVRLPADHVLDDAAVAPLPDLGEPRCLVGEGADMLAGMTAGVELFHGADYQRAFALPDGRTLWLFQDAMIATPTGLALVHNAGLVQSGNCFQALHGGTADAPAPYLFGAATVPMQRWFWPMSGGIGTDGRLHVFVAEMVELGERYLSHTEPVATWIVTIDVESMAVLEHRPAPNLSADLYGWSVASDDAYSYLYAHCYRQFGYDPLPLTDPPVLVHDWSCAANVTVARVPLGRFDLSPTYWNGSVWQDDPTDAVPVIPTEGRAVNPTQVARVDDGFVAVTKIDDWWGRTIVVDRAPNAEGPWTTVATVDVTAPCPECTTYFASVVPDTISGSELLVGLSNNTWVGTDPSRYGVSFLTVPIA